jgi:hypothetical protein
MQQREEQVLTAVFAGLDLALDGKISSKEALTSLQKVLQESLADNLRDRDGWEHAEKKAGALFEQCDQDLEFNCKVKWYNVECLISSTKLLNLIRLKLATKGVCFEAVKRWFTTTIYQSNVICRFCNEGPIHEKQSSFLKDVVYATKKDFVLLCSNFDKKDETNDRKESQLCSKSMELMSILGISSDLLKILKPEASFITFIPFWRDYKVILDMLDSYIASQFALGECPVDGLGDLVVTISLFRKYQTRNLPIDIPSEILTVELVIKACDKLILAGQNSDSYEEAFTLYKAFLDVLNPYDVNLGDRLDCLHKIKTGDFKELLKYKQSLNLSNPADILFDLLIDLFRMSLPSANAAPSVAVLLHKLSTPGVSQFLTGDLMASCRQYFSGPNSFSYLLLLHASLPYNPQLVGIFLHTVVDWAGSIRDKLRLQELPLVDIKEFFSQVGLRKAEEIVIKEGKIGYQEHKAIFLKASYLCFYLAKLAGDRQSATLCLQILFKLAEGVENLWTLNEESGAFFLDIIQILLPEKETNQKTEHGMDIEGISSVDESKTILNFISLLAQKKESDTPRVSAFKSILYLKLDLAQIVKRESTNREQAIASVFKNLSFEEICSALKSELSVPSVYYTFFFHTMSNYLENGVDDPCIVRSIIQLMIYLYEELVSSEKNIEKNSAFTVFPMLCQKVIPLVEGLIDKSIGERLATHLFNIWVEQRDFSLLQLAFKIGGSMKSTIKPIISAYLFELVKTKDFEKCQQEFYNEVALWLNEELSSEKVLELTSIPPRSSVLINQGKMDAEKYIEPLDELDKLEEDFHKDNAKDDIISMELSRPQILFIKVINSYYLNPEESITIFSNFISKEGNKLSEDDYAVLVYATSMLPEKNLHSQLLRHYLSRLLSVGESATSKLLEIYQSLLESTDSVRELKTYLIQMEGVIEMANPSDKMITSSEIKSLVLQLAKVKADFQSLSEQISRVANSIARKWDVICNQVKGIDRILAYVKDGSSS